MQQSSKIKINPKISIYYLEHYQEKCGCFRLGMTFDENDKIYDNAFKRKIDFRFRRNTSPMKEGDWRDTFYTFQDDLVDGNKMIKSIAIVIPNKLSLYSIDYGDDFLSILDIMKIINSGYQLDFESMKEQIQSFEIDDNEVTQLDKFLFEMESHESPTKENIKNNALKMIDCMNLLLRIVSALENSENIGTEFPRMKTDIESLIKKNKSEELKKEINDQTITDLQSFLISGFFQEALGSNTKKSCYKRDEPFYFLIHNFCQKCHRDMSFGKDFSEDFVLLLNIADKQIIDLNLTSYACKKKYKEPAANTNSLSTGFVSEATVHVLFDLNINKFE